MAYTTSNERIQEIVDYALDKGDDEALELFSINVESLSRYKRQYKKINANRFKEKKLLRELQDNFSDKELAAMLKSKESSYENSKTVRHTFDGEIVTFAHVTDTHIGSVYFDPRLLLLFFEECESQGVDFICHSGDLTEGLSNRPGHIYELSHLGFEQQKNFAIELWEQCPIKTYIISGNHDRYYMKSNGANIVGDIANNIDTMEFLGHDEGDLNINGVLVRLFHGGDGSSYASSYRLQKLIESFTGGEKPHVLLAGHTHKALYLFDRNVHCISGGALSYQSSWMRGKKLANHTGFYIIKMCISDNEVKWIEPRFYPFYKKLKVAIEV